jgi:hypothetical protein
VLLAAGTFVKRDTDVFPFIDDVSLSPSAGTLLATVTIVPEQSTALLVATGLIGLAVTGRHIRAESRHARSAVVGAPCPTREQRNALDP